MTDVSDSPIGHKMSAYLLLQTDQIHLLKTIENVC